MTSTDPYAAPPAQEPLHAVPAPPGTAAEVLDWVADDPERARGALVAERLGKHRKGLVADLQQIADR